MEDTRKSTRERIFDAALKIFSQKGYNGATTSEIAREAGVAEGTIFRYFPTKKDLLFSVVNPIVVDSLKNVIADYRDRPPREMLEAVLHNRLDIINRNIELVKILVSEAQFQPELREKFLTKVILPAASLMQEYFREQEQKGVLRDVNTEISIRVLVGMVAVFVVWKNVFEGEEYVRFTDDEVVSAIVDIFLNGMLKD